MMIKIVEGLSEFTGKLSAWMFFAVGLFITYEVFMRYVFVMPTIWVDEVSRITQIWAAYLAGAYAMKYREMIVIDIAFKDPNTIGRKLVETFALIVVAFFCFVAVWYGIELWWKATIRGHTTDTYLGLPKWFTQASVWVGFGLLFLQTIVELIKVWTIGVVNHDHLDGAH
ncbi:MAG: TRAP transporter small permease [Sneathiella sp.]|nr:TRAP transporter small permease [Sneathiella sp.]